MKFARLAALVTTLGLTMPAFAQEAEDAAEEAARPTLIVAISVDQLSADLFATYREHFSAGFARLLSGAVFPSGYQAQSATETCPGHSTILTGAFPSRSGIVANRWFDMDVERDDVRVYCAEDPSVEGSSSREYTRSNANLLVPTLGDLLRRADSNSRTVSVSGKDRGAIMLGGETEMAFWPGASGFGSYAANDSEALARINQAATQAVVQGAEPLAVPQVCRAVDRAIAIGDGQTVGTHHFGREAGDAAGLLATPEIDLLTLNLAGDLAEEMELGRRGSIDILAISLSATDYIGHRYGTHGVEQCIQLMALDAMLGAFFERLDAGGVPYIVMLTADHGGLDLPERASVQGAPDAARLNADIATVEASIAEAMGLETPILRSEGPFGDFYVDRSVPEERRAEVIDRAVATYSAHPQVYRVYSRDEIASQPMPSAPPENWTVLDRIRVNFHPERSGDFYVVLQPRVTPIPDPGVGYVATHGSVWDYDRRVPILFWWNGAENFEQPMGVMTVDIMPTLASLVGFDIGNVEIDGSCLDLDPDVAESNCP